MTEEDNCWIIVTGGQKGGTGKTTIATNLATLFAAMGWKVLLVNADNQRSLVTWNDQRAELGRETVEGQGKDFHELTLVSQFGKNLHKDVKKLTPQYDVAIIDAGGFDSTEFRSALLVADVLVSPINASSFDTWTLSQVHEIIEGAKINNPDLKAGLILNRVNASSVSEAKAALRAIVEDEEDPLESFFLYKKAIVNRNAYSRAPALGLTVHEMPRPDAKAKEEMVALQQEILEIFTAASEEAA
ncbi:AAA family ATPase [Thalassospira lucentensis]|jgi:chromosome partitioning protein|uniref:nucleotide-binding protein n=1 Tax=Thalassospira lucentensis TaxID=168935 RepID=UPI00294261E9|nr:AAA family ATPase [Thalassospira lucentensis]WOI08922.1 AAA family ATPase [Thalassospira lucentensis]